MIDFVGPLKKKMIKKKMERRAEEEAHATDDELAAEATTEIP